MVSNCTSLDMSASFHFHFLSLHVWHVMVQD
jgi:hypothetical protein